MSRERTKGTNGPASAHGSVRNTLDTDGMLAEWGARLFYPIPKGKDDSGGGKLPLVALAAAMTPMEVRSQIRSTVAPGATQVMVKITGGGRGMKAIAAHFRYIGRLGKDEAGGRGQTLEIEDERGEKIRGGAGLAQLTDEWRVAGAYIDDTSSRREAFNIIFSMPAGTPPEAVREATADAARELFEGHKYVFVLLTPRSCSPRANTARQRSRSALRGARRTPSYRSARTDRCPKALRLGVPKGW